MQKFSLVLRTGNQWETRVQKVTIDFRTTRIPECQEYPQLAFLRYPVQALLVEQYKIARKEIVEGEEPQEKVSDELVCPVDCLFIANISSYASTCGIIASPHVLFQVPIGRGGRRCLKMVVLRFMS